MAAPATLHTLARDLESIVAKAREAMRSLSDDAERTPDFEGVERLSKDALVVRSSTLFARGGSTMNMTMTVVDAKRQAHSIVELIGQTIDSPKATARQVEELLRKGTLRSTPFDAEVIERFRASLEDAQRIAGALLALKEAMRPTTATATTPER